ncbi:uroporphyrinogen-III synthase [Sphingomonas sp.]|uniref:uroporphyrinogen-III synthase n=1 Tax=Sphingomonas sp. TaxID=28214 RepID=UPI0025CBE395|nr:uroporphyrinogen-III synthase [Sphingomonas sp.]
MLRPQPGASATAARIAALGHEAIVAPLFAIEPVAWDVPDPGEHDAIILTSANAVRHAGPALAELAALPVHAVGTATAAAAMEAGLSVVATGHSDGAELLERAATGGVRKALHLAGADHRAIARDDIGLRRIIVYRSEPVGELPAEAREALSEAGAVVLLHSPRAAGQFRTLLVEAGLSPGHVALAGISAQTLHAAGEGWAATALAARPTDDALLAAAARLCETGAGMRGDAGV